MCEKYGTVYLKLRGLCEDSNIDTYWVPGTDLSLYKLYGTVSSEIGFQAEKSNWKLTVFSRTEKTVATSQLTYHSFAMGKSLWLVVNDSKGI